jgi:hypothetical protein
MAGQGVSWLVESALRCYPASWRRRHGNEAADLAALLIRDGTPAGSVACSYLAGAAREWLTPRLGTVAYALLVAACLLGVSLGLLSRTAPARAASTSQPHARVHCHARSHEPARTVTSATGRQQVLIREAGRDRGC